MLGDDVLQDITITDEFSEPGRSALRFDARVAGVPIEFVEVLRFDSAGSIRTITVAARPISGIEALAAAVAPHLAEIRGA